MSKRINNSFERGVATIEFAITASFFFLMLVAVVSGGHFYWTHNALVEATRRGARYGANQCFPDQSGCPDSNTTIARVKNVVLYNSSTAGASPIVPSLQASNVIVTYSTNPAYGIASGTVSVKIQNYQYRFMGVNITMPPYETTVQGENAGWIPATIP